MGTTAIGVLDSVGAATGEPRVEIALVGVIVAVALVLLVIRSLRRVELRRRRATSVPFERPGTVQRASGPGRGQGMAPTFAASRRADPPRGRAATGGRAAPTRQPTGGATESGAGTPAAPRPPTRPGTTPRTAVPANLPPLAPAPPAR